MRKTAVLHPFLVAIYPILSLLGSNIYQTSWQQAFRACCLSLAAAFILLLIWRLLTRDWQKAGLLTTLALFLFYSYGHIIRIINGQFSTVNLINLNLMLTSLWAIILILGSWFIWRIVKRDLSGLTRFLNIVLAVALIFPIYAIVVQAVRSPNIVQASNTVTETHSASNKANPDIYYIISDAYTNDDVLAEIYGYDNSPFIQELEEIGFFVARDSHSNYSQTLLSLPSTLNMTYLDHIIAQVGRESEDREPLEQYLHQSEVIRFLKEQGYQTVSFTSGYESTEFTEFDHYLASDASLINAFEVLLIQDTWFGSLFSLNLKYETKRRQNLFIFDALKETTEIPGPKFVFAHATITHFPFVFGPNGESLNPSQVYEMDDGINMTIDQSVYKQRYSDQVTFTNQLLLETIDHIIAHSETPPIILIQGDHGPELFLDNNSLENTCVKERLSIMNAYFFPGINQEQLYDSVTPVNTFRIILNNYFETDLELFEDRSYFSTWNQPYNPIDVTEQLDIACVNE